MTAFRYVGKDIPRTLETDKVTGRAVYIDDLKLPGMLYGKILYSSYVNARIKRIDTARATKLSRCSRRTDRPGHSRRTCRVHQGPDGSQKGPRPPVSR